MRDKAFIFLSLTLFIFTNGIIIFITDPSTRDIIDIVLELSFTFLPILWIYFAKRLFKRQEFTRALYLGCIFFFLGGVFEILEESYVNIQFLDDIEDILMLLGITFISYSVYRIALKTKLKLENLSKENRDNYLDSIQDSLTMLYNKRYLQSNFTEIFENNPAIFSGSVCVFIDIDNFKKFNDKYGHKDGDKVLEKLGEFINSSKRKGDFAFRYGGEEFVIFYMNANRNFILHKLEELRENFKTYCLKNYKNSNFEVSLSIGNTIYTYGEELSDMIHRADKAMYIAKFSGKDRINSL